eukprot:13415612-Ditylum_brightwellii.AAC.1
MWQKIRSMWAYAYQYREEYDFFHIAGDDVYIAIDNMQAYFDSTEVIPLEDGYMDVISSHRSFRNKAEKWKDIRPRLLLFGIPMPHKGMLVPAGGPGYTLNRAVVELFIDKILSTCLATNRDPCEDVFVGSCFNEHGVMLSVTKDTNNADRYGGSARF